MNAGNENHTRLAPSMKTACDFLYSWKKKITYTQISPSVLNPRGIARNAEEEEERARISRSFKEQVSNSSPIPLANEVSIA